MQRKKRDLLTAVLFFLCLFFFFWKNELLCAEKGKEEYFLSELYQSALQKIPLKEKDAELKAVIARREKFYSDNLYRRLGFAEGYGKLQRRLGKQMLDDPKEDMRVYREEGGHLFYGIPRRVELQEKADSLEGFARYLRERGIDFVAVSAPNRNEMLRDYLPRGITDFSGENRRAFLEELRKRGLRTVDLHEELAGERGEEMFYRTDTHWRNRTALRAAEILGDLFPEALLPEGKKELRFREISYPGSYIGSMGKRSGKYFFDGKDDYSLLLPEQKSSYYYMKTENPDQPQWERRGSFEEVFVREDILGSEEEYIDRYTAMMGYGTGWEYIRNEDLREGRVLMIKDSFGMPLAAYLSLQVHEICLVDLRNPLMKDRLKALIEERNPQQVIFLYSPTSLYYFEEMFDLP